MKVRAALFHVGMPTANGNVYTQEALEKILEDMESGKTKFKGDKILHAWLEDDKLMAEFEASGESCPTCSKRSVSCSVAKDK